MSPVMVVWARREAASVVATRSPKLSARLVRKPGLGLSEIDEFAAQRFEEVLAWPRNYNKHLRSDHITIVVIDVELSIQPSFVLERSR
jgi:hypothetical protein